MTAAGRSLRFLRQYTVPVSGRLFCAFEAPDGRRVDVCVRTGRGEAVRYGRREAREIAADKLAGSPPVWLVRCPDWTHGPVTRAAAEAWAAAVEQLGECRNVHEIVRATPA